MNSRLHSAHGESPFIPEPTTRELLLAAQPALGIARRLDELMRRCREEHHTPTYADLLALKGSA